MLKNQRKNSKNRGFTLIEVVIYLALFTIIIGGGMVSTYSIIESTNAGSNQVTLQEEANFLLRKVDWALIGASSVSVIISPPTLIVTKTGLPTLLFDLNSSNLRLTRGGASPVILNSSNTKVSNLSFTHITGGGKPDAITTTFTLTTAQNGRNTSQIFTTTKYLRK